MKGTTMKPSYSDILSAVGGRAVEWWDEHGVPRFSPFHPGTPYNRETRSSRSDTDLAVLADAECQTCHWQFRAGAASMFYVGYTRGPRNNLRTEFGPNTLERFCAYYHYGTPPRHDIPGRPGEECPGVSVLSHMLRIVEAWQLTGHDRWERHPEREQSMDDIWNCRDAHG